MSAIGMEESQRTAFGAPAGDNARGRDVLRRIRAVVLLAGSTGWRNLSASLRQSVLDLPIDSESSVIQQWQSQIREMAGGLDLPHVSVRLMIDPASLEPTSRQDCPRAKLSVERDPYEYRGSGGVLYDVSHDYDGDDWLLVASGGQVLFQPLADLAERMADRGGDVCVVAHEDGTPSGLMLIRAACLSVIPAIGFVDMKEQALPRIAEDYQVNVMRLDQISGMPIRTLDGYIAALRQRHLQLSGDTSWENAFAERRPVFQIVQDGTSVSDDAELQDSVVLEGGRVAAGAVVVRSIVSGRGNVPAGRMVVDQIVASSAGPRPRPGQGGPS
ncbi:MAG: hypothetical protein CMJ49_00580 [Planctomycetaceae bacterium]|nr:hypothetical protein [Planctomycetaceae bacterium]